MIVYDLNASVFLDDEVSLRLVGVVFGMILIKLTLIVGFFARSDFVGNSYCVIWICNLIGYAETSFTVPDP